jgi:hypothetical protein
VCPDLAEIAVSTNGSGLAVAVNDTDADRPVTVALRVFVPGTSPSVQLPTAAIPFAFVVCEAPVIEPPPVVTAKVTAAPPTGLSY